MDKSTAKKVHKLMAEGKSPNEAMALLVKEGMSPSTAQELVQVLAIPPAPEPHGHKAGKAPKSAKPLSPEQLLHYGSSGSENMANSAASQRHKRIMIALIAIPVVLLVIGAIITSQIISRTSAGTESTLKTTTYDNGSGVRAQLLFYPDHTYKNSTATTAKTRLLVSKTEVDGHYPLVLMMTKATQRPSDSTLECSVNGPGLSVRNEPTGKTVNLCPINQQVGSYQTTIYYGVLQSGSIYYALVFLQDVDSETLAKDGPEAMARKVGLVAYHDDIAKIVASIKPLQ